MYYPTMEDGWYDYYYDNYPESEEDYYPDNYPIEDYYTDNYPIEEYHTNNYQNRYNRPRYSNVMQRATQPSYHVRKFFKVLQFRHHYYIFQKVNQTGDITPHFQKKVKELFECVHPASPTPELEVTLRDLAEEWARKVCKALFTHYSNMYQESKQELCDVYTNDEIEQYRHQAVQWAKENWTNRLQDKTISGFMRTDFKPVDRERFETSLNNHTPSRQPEDIIIQQTSSPEPSEISPIPPSTNLEDPPSTNLEDPPSANLEDPPSANSEDPPSANSEDPPSTNSEDTPSTNSEDPPITNTEQTVVKRRQLVAKRNQITKRAAYSDLDKISPVFQPDQSARIPDQQTINTDHLVVNSSQQTVNTIPWVTMLNETAPERKRLVAKRKPLVSGQNHRLDSFVKIPMNTEVKTPSESSNWIQPQAKKDDELLSLQLLCNQLKAINVIEQSISVIKQESLPDKSSPTLQSGVKKPTCNVDNHFADPKEKVTTRQDEPVNFPDESMIRSVEPATRSEPYSDEPVIGSVEPASRPDEPCLDEPVTIPNQSVCIQVRKCDQQVFGHGQTMPNKHKPKTITSKLSKLTPVMKKQLIKASDEPKMSKSTEQSKNQNEDRARNSGNSNRSPRPTRRSTKSTVTSINRTSSSKKKTVIKEIRSSTKASTETKVVKIVKSSISSSKSKMWRY